MRNRRAYPAVFRRRAAALLLSLLMLPPVGWAEGLPNLGDPSQEDLSPAMEKRIGESVMAEYRRDSGFIDDPEIVGYVNRIGHKLAANSEEVTQPFEFFVMRDETLNAFAMPGGFVGVHSGLIKAAQSESELAGVLAHEISHVTQHHLARLFAKQNQTQVPLLAAMVLALLAARNNSDIAMGATVAAQGAAIQGQLNYSRDFEREADRIGLGLLERSGFDVRGMESFFERLQKFGRLYENNAPGYLRTHPLTTERIADMGNRVQGKPYKQVRDSVEFLLVRAKLRAQEGQARDAVADFSAQLKERKYSSEMATRFGLAYAQLRVQNTAAAAKEVQELRRMKVQSYMIDTLDAQVLQQQGNLSDAEKLLRQAQSRYTQERAVSYALIEVLLQGRQYDAGLALINSEIQLYPGDARLFALQAKSYAAVGKKLLQHKAQADAYMLNGQLLPAIEQLQLAQKAPDGNFYEHSQVDARLRELKQKQADESKEKKLP